MALISALRRLRRRPALAVTVAITLAIAIGATTAVWSLLETVALRPLPYPEADRLIQIGAAVPGQSELQEISWPKFQAVAAGSRELAATAAWYTGSFGLTESSGPRELAGARVSERFFEVWGVVPRFGRLFTVDEARAGGADVVLLSESFWQSRFAADPAVIGRTLTIDGRSTTIVGVLPALLRFPFKETEIWLPRADEAPFLPRNVLERGAGYLQVAARLAPAARLSSAQKELDRISDGYAAERPEQYDRGYRLAAVAMTERLVGPVRATLFVLLAAVALVLVVAGADVANLLLLDSLARRRELAVRTAIGASARRLLGELAAESALLAGAGGALGVGFAATALALLVRLQPADLPRIDDVRLSWAALGLAFLLTAGAGALALLLPAVRASRSDPRTALAEAERGSSAGRGSARWQGALVATQVALALVLVSSAALLARSLLAVDRLELGFEPRHLLFVQTTLPEASYPTSERRRALYDDLLARVRETRGVDAAALAEYPPTVGAPHAHLEVEGAAPVAPEELPLVQRMVVSDGYFEALGARFRAGAGFDPRASPDAPLTAVVSRSLVDLLFAGSSSDGAIGRRVRLRASDTPIEIVGVVDDLRQQPFELDFEPTIYLPLRQLGSVLPAPNSMTLALRSERSPVTLAEAVRRALGRIDPAQPLSAMTSAREMLAQATARRRLTTGILAGFSLLAVALALLGVYGVVAHAISLRRREIAVRSAIGAAPRRLLGESVWLGGRWIAPGLLAGALAALGAGRALASQLFGIAGAGALHLAAATLVLAAVATAACFVPARRAARIDPATTLRGE